MLNTIKAARDLDGNDLEHEVTVTIRPSRITTGYLAAVMHSESGSTVDVWFRGAQQAFSLEGGTEVVVHP